MAVVCGRQLRRCLFHKKKQIGGERRANLKRKCEAADELDVTKKSSDLGLAQIRGSKVDSSDINLSKDALQISGPGQIPFVWGA